MKALAPNLLLLGLGGNLGTEEQVLARMREVAQAARAWGAVSCSSVLRTAPIGPAQPAFLNAALRISLAAPSWQPTALISAVLELERRAGRDRSTTLRWGPRAIDVDVLAWGARVAQWPGPPELVVPHPRWAQRRFALAPAVEVLGEDAYELPGTGRSLGQWLAEEQVAEQQVQPTAWRLGSSGFDDEHGDALGG